MALKKLRKDNYPEWYQCVVSEANMAENSSSPGCMVIKPWGYGIWERIRDVFDKQIKEADHENCQFPMFIPLSFFQKEAEHVDGFAIGDVEEIQVGHDLFITEVNASPYCVYANPNTIEVMYGI